MIDPVLHRCEAFRSFANCAASPGAPCPAASFRRALRQLAAGTGGAERLRSLDELAAWTPGSLLPPPERVQAVIFGPVTAAWPPGPTSFGAGAGPVAGWPERACLSLVQRRWDPSGRLLVAKVRMGVFLGADGRLRWDFGIVAANPSIGALRAGLHAAAREAPHFGARIDLTPASLAVVPLALRLGGRPDSDSALRQACIEARQGARTWRPPRFTLAGLKSAPTPARRAILNAST